MGETKIPLSVVKELLDQQNRVHDAQLKLLAEYIERCAVKFELALNPPLPPIDPQDKIADELFANPRMSEEEEDLRYALQLGDISQVEYDLRLKQHLNGTYEE